MSDKCKPFCTYPNTAKPPIKCYTCGNILGFSSADKALEDMEKQLKMSDEMPEEIWATYNRDGHPYMQPWSRYEGKTGDWLAYRLKSTEDKTIRGLAAALENINDIISGHPDGLAIFLELVEQNDRILTTHAARITESQEN